MDITASGPDVGAIPRIPTTTRVWPPAFILFVATMTWAVGSTWDIQWHSDVGPDTFFTLPHLFIYASAAIAGFASLAVVLVTTAARRASKPIDPTVGGTGIGVFGRTFTAPIGYLVCGCGAASFLLFGLWDLWWHSLYGFDAIIDSPPHIGLFLSSTVTSVGAVMVFAAAREHLWGRIGTLACLAHLLTSSTVTALAVRRLDGGAVQWTTVATVFMVMTMLLTGAGFRNRAGGAVLTAVFAAGIQAVFWWFAPWSARTYAAFVGLPMREHVQIIPATPALIPLSLIAVAVVVELVLLRAHRTESQARLLPMLGGAVGGAIIATAAHWQRVLIYHSVVPDAGVIIATAIAGAAFGGLAGFLGWRFGRMLRMVTPATDVRNAA